MKKRFLAWLLCLCMVCALVPAAAFGEEEAPPAAEEPEVQPLSTATSGDFWKVEGETLTITGEMAYTGDAPWLAHKDSITQAIIEEGVAAIPEKAFAELTKCRTIRIPASVTAIGDNAFLNTGSAYATGYRVHLFTGYTQAQTESWVVADYEKYGLVYNRTNLIYDHYDLDDHDYEPYAEPSTCKVNGFSGQACRCGNLLGDMLPLAEHTSETIPAVPATCTEKGKGVGTKCSVCGKILSAPLDTAMIPHTPVDVPALAPTETTEGHKAGTKCSVCGKVLSGCEVLAATAAKQGTLDTDKGKDTVKWTIDSQGVLRVTGQGAITKETPWSKHRETITRVIIAEGITGLPEGAFRKFEKCYSVSLPASVTSIGDGAFTGMATAEKDKHLVLYTAYTQAYVDSLTDANKKRMGFPEGTIVAPDHYDADTHTHWSDPVTYPATCLAPGRKERTCSCGLAEVLETYAQLSHTVEELPGKAATCLEKGITTGEKCTVCNTVLVEQREIDVLPHAPVAVKEKMPSATEDGYTAGTKCSVCGTVLTGCEAIKASNTAYSGVVLTDEGNAEWVLYENGTLTILSGKGNIKEAPWLAYESKVHIKTVMVCEDITGLPQGAFKDCDRLTTVSLPQSLTSVRAEAFSGCDQIKEIYLPKVTVIGNSAFYKCSKLETLELGKGLKTIGSSAFYYCKALKSVTLPEGLETIGEYAFQKCNNLTAIRIPNSVKNMGKGAFKDCTDLTDVSVGTGLAQIKEEVFSGDKYIKTVTLRNTLTVARDDAFKGCSKLETVYYYGTEAQWKDMVIGLNNEALTGAKIVYLYKETVANKVTLNLDGTGLEGLTVYIDGVAYSGEDRVKGEKVSITLPNSKARTAVIYTWNKTGDDVDPHEKYPTAMYVWMLSQEDGMYVSTRVSALDNILAYAGSSIRIAGKKGIRMITGVTETAKKGLTGSKGFEGYTLVEYGTIVAWVDDLKGADLVLSTPGVKGGQAYSKAAKKDAVYKKTNGQVQYTNVLVGFTEEQCKPDLAMRPYMILEDAEGNQYILYGGTVERSIGYIAYQNRAAFKSGTPSYEYIWSIIHVVYGDKYDADYKR